MKNLLHKSLLFFPKILLFWALVALAFFSSCETEVPIPPLPETKPKLVLFSLISPETKGIQVSVTKTIPLSTGNPETQNIVTDATVLFSDSQDTIVIPYDAGLKVYSLPNYAVQPGKMYWLNVTSPGGFSAKAQCYVPDKINQTLTAAIDSTSTSPGATNKSYVVELNWEDLPGSGDYYRIDSKLVSRQGEQDSINMLDVPLARDYLADGRKWQRRSEILPLESLIRPGDKPDSVYAYLLTTDQAYYDFHNSLYKLINSGTVLGSFSDPISLYTNVEGGFGLFAGYRSNKVGVKF